MAEKIINEENNQAMQATAHSFVGRGAGTLCFIEFPAFGIHVAKTFIFARETDRDSEVPYEIRLICIGETSYS